ncbi:unnamed protein product [Moneuplotes crassus]|uniref:Uncharacterized protein n=1 Tax=Euplotes crassus TaxID=5936 RepID=A0AAD1URY6_EUPCR|nr:unnamed protein product [Moneuplotes crassus]
MSVLAKFNTMPVRFLSPKISTTSTMCGMVFYLICIDSKMHV